MAEIVFLNNSTAVEIQGLKNSSTNNVDEGAAASIVVKTLEGTNVAGQQWPLILAHQGAGRYLGVLDSALVLTENTKYVGEVTVLGSGGETATWNIDIQASIRRSNN